MSDYCTNAEVKARFRSTAEIANLTDSTDPDTPNDSIITECRQAAEGEINGYLARRYAVPLDTSADTGLAGALRGMALDLTVYKLYARQGQVSEAHASARNQVIEWCQRVASGEILIPSALTPTGTANDSPSTDWDCAVRIFAHDSYKGVAGGLGAL